MSLHCAIQNIRTVLLDVFMPMNTYILYVFITYYSVIFVSRIFNTAEYY